MADDSTRDTAFDVDFFETVLRHDAQCVEAMEILGGLYTKLGRIADGLRMDRRLVRLQPSNPTAPATTVRATNSKRSPHSGSEPTMESKRRIRQPNFWTNLEAPKKLLC